MKSPFFQDGTPSGRNQGKAGRWLRLVLAATAGGILLWVLEALQPRPVVPWLKNTLDGPEIVQPAFVATVTATPYGGMPAALVIEKANGPPNTTESWVLDLTRHELVAPDSVEAGRLGVVAAEAHAIRLRRWEGNLLVEVNGRPAGRLAVGDGGLRLRTYGLELEDFRVQRLAAFVFADDFGRTTLGNGDGWEIGSGDWRILYDSQRAAAPNAFIGSGASGKARQAVMTTGHDFWSGYRFEASVRLGRADAVSLLVGWTGPNDFMEVRLSPLGMQVIEHRDGTTGRRAAPVAGKPMGLLRDTWYRVWIELGDDRTIACALDGDEPVKLRLGQRLTGRIGLAVEGDRAECDDLRVEFPVPDGPPPLTPLRAISQPYSQKPRYRKDDRDDHLDRWAKDADAWQTEEVTTPRGPLQAWRFHLALFGDFEVAPGDQAGTVLLTDLENRELARANLAPNGTLRRQGGQVTADGLATPLELTGPCLVWYLPARPPMGSQRPQIVARGVYQEFFEQAPANWLCAGGEWSMTNRWQCEQRWAFYGGLGPATVAEFCKLRFKGDQRHEVYFGMKDLFRREFERRRYARHDVNVSIRTNGKDLFSGYTLMFGGFNNEFTCLMRRKHVVATNAADRFAEFVDIDDLHLFWRRLRLECVGDRVRAWLDDQPLIDYRDPYPDSAPNGDYMALWTYRNGVVFARLNSAAEEIEPSTLALGDPPQPGPVDGWAPLDPDRVGIDREGRVTNRMGGGTFAVVWQQPAPVDLDATPVLQLPLELPTTAKVNLHLVVNGQGLIVPLTAPVKDTWQVLGSGLPWSREPDWAIYGYPPLTAPAVEGEPREEYVGTLRINLREEVRRRFPGMESPRVTSLIIGNTSLHRYLTAGLDGNASGTRYRVGPVLWLPATAE